MSSRLSEAARRLRAAAGILSNADDVALINEYADELESLASKAQDLKTDARDAHDESLDTRARFLKTCLEKAFPVPPGTPFNGLLIMLDETHWSGEAEAEQAPPQLARI